MSGLTAMGCTPALMLQGTGSHVGKSLLVAGLGRAFSRRGLRVRPFKPQNMSNNAAVTADAGEIGRAQALQARACGVAPSVHMNPVLLKPQSEVGAQVVVQGRVLGNYDARAYFELRPTLMPHLLESYERIAREADLVLVEGAGSPAEVNLRTGDIANMGFAAAADVPVVLVGDIERGGVIAALVGTFELLEPAERARLKGYIVNKFRGDPALFDDAHGIIKARTGMRSFGVVPWFERARLLPAEDILGLEERAAPGAAGAIRIAVPRLPRLANFDDLDPLAAEPDVVLRIVPPGAPLPGDADLVILPGSKATLADLAALRAEGWDVDLAAHVRRGGAVLGICGGLQMLGRRIADPVGIEGPPAEAAGLGLLDLATTLQSAKRLAEVSGREVASGERLQGYEMHVGETTGPALARPMLELAGRPDGAVSEDGRIMGCYVHGLFAADGFRHAFLARLRERAVSGVAYETQIEASLDALADHLEASLDTDGLLALARAGA
jgi:adenosylcobyric acid synthase